MLPQIKKTISSFLSEEEGKISKQSLLTVGALLGAAIVAQPGTAAHTSNLSHTDSYTLTNPQPGQVVSSHQHYDPSQSVSTTGTTSCPSDSGSPLFRYGETKNAEFATSGCFQTTTTGHSDSGTTAITTATTDDCTGQYEHCAGHGSTSCFTTSTTCFTGTTTSCFTKLF